MAARKQVKGPQVYVGIVMGSASDWSVMEQAAQQLEAFGVAHEVRVLSAHRTPAAAAAYARAAERRGVKVLIAGAGMAAHLAGVLAAHTPLPVIGVPLRGGALDGLDALLSMAEMPAGVPVATVALGTAGAVNAALLAGQILALADSLLAARFRAYKADLARQAVAAERKLLLDRRAQASRAP
ncbi:MAG: 5-(carboxyamino)imidazole ribonucleotide mutase [Candidatus Marinimicrobia bacterium]|nr:5-(carboxyamino)imidazole ribonucleotide mutase [Candidatus Neomarinimicrobiota bacterium]